VPQPPPGTSRVAVELAAVLNEVAAVAPLY